MDIICFFLAAFKNHSLSLTFATLITIYLGIKPLWFILLELSVLPGPKYLFSSPRFPLESFQPLFLQIYFLPLSVFSLWNPCKANVRALDVVPEVPYTILISLLFFSFCCSNWVISTILSSRSLTHSLVIISLLPISSNVFLISVTVFLFFFVFLIFLFHPAILFFCILLYFCFIFLFPYIPYFNFSLLAWFLFLTLSIPSPSIISKSLSIPLNIS